MVVILLPATAARDVEQDRAGWPLTCTVHAPHAAMPQPYLVPVMPRLSSNAHSRGVEGSTSTCNGLPLMSSVVMGEAPWVCLPWSGPGMAQRFDPPRRAAGGRSAACA